MKRAIYLFLIAGTIVRTASAQQERYSVRPTAASRSELNVFKTGLYRGKVHTFLFPKYSGTLLYDRGRPEASRIQMTWAAGAVTCMDTWLSTKDLKSVQEYALNNMLRADRYPEILFTSSDIQPLGRNHFRVDGMLTIRGVPRPSTI